MLASLKGRSLPSPFGEAKKGSLAPPEEMARFARKASRMASGHGRSAPKMYLAALEKCTHFCTSYKLNFNL
jgi:hypothetical protein